MKRLLAVVALGLALAVPTRASRAALPPRDTSLLDSILAGMQTDLRSVRLGAPGAGWRVRDGRKWLYVVPRAAATTAEQMRDEWYATLIAGAYAARCESAGADCIAGYSTKGLVAYRLNLRSLPVAPLEKRSVSRRIGSVFARVGLTHVSVGFERPFGLAPVVTVRAKALQRAVNAYSRTRGFRWPGLEGYLVWMVGPKGKPFLVSGGSSRLDVGEGWVRPDLKVAGVPTAGAG